MPKLGRKNTVLLILIALAILLLAWWQGGERPVRLIEEDVPVPENAL